MQASYRSRIYDQYNSRGRGEVADFDAAAAGRWGRAYDRYLPGWLPADKGAAIADVACGAGGLLYFFKTRGFGNLAGIDISPEQVRIARQVVPAVEEGDVFGFLRARPGQFDLITALDLVEHLTKDEVFDFLDACHGALRPGGRLILQTPNADSPFGPGVRYGDFTHEVCFTPHSLGWLLGLSGFGGIESRECGPRPRGLFSSARSLLWQLIRLGVLAWNLVETGSAGSGVYTRVFVISGVKT